MTFFLPFLPRIVSPLALLIALVGCGASLNGSDPPSVGDADAGISTADAASPDSSAPIAEGDFINGDFEQGPGVGWTEFPSQLIYQASQFDGTAYSGSWVARLGPDSQNSHSIVLEQQIRLPSNATQIAFAAYIDSEEICDVPWYDDLTLLINNQVIFEYSTLCNDENSSEWEIYSVDVSAVAGQTIWFSFKLYSNPGDVLASTVYIDSVGVY